MSGTMSAMSSNARDGEKQAKRYSSSNSKDIRKNRSKPKEKKKYKWPSPNQIKGRKKDSSSRKVLDEEVGYKGDEKSVLKVESQRQNLVAVGSKTKAVVALKNAAGDIEGTTNVATQLYVNNDDIQVVYKLLKVIPKDSLTGADGKKGKGIGDYVLTDRVRNLFKWFRWGLCGLGMIVFLTYVKDYFIFDPDYRFMAKRHYKHCNLLKP